MAFIEFPPENSGYRGRIPGTNQTITGRIKTGSSSCAGFAQEPKASRFITDVSLADDSRPGKSPEVGEWSCRVFFLVALSLDSIWVRRVSGNGRDTGQRIQGANAYKRFYGISLIPAGSQKPAAQRVPPTGQRAKSVREGGVEQGRE